jgi:hypothetical protein
MILSKRTKRSKNFLREIQYDAVLVEAEQSLKNRCIEQLGD